MTTRKRSQEFDVRHLNLKCTGAVLLLVRDQHVLWADTYGNVITRRETVGVDAGADFYAAYFDAPIRRDLSPDEVCCANEIRNERRRRFGINFSWCSDLLDHAMVHHDNSVGHGEGFFLVVRDHDGGNADLLL